MSKEEQPSQKPFLERFLGTLGQFLAVAYGGLCGMGINARVLAAFNSIPLAYAIGSVTFFVNLVLFWTIVPNMLIKLFVRQDLFDESFPTKTRSGKEAYAKLRRNNQIEKLKFWPWEEGFSLRAWIVLSFVAFFGLCGGLAYTGLLMMTLSDTLSAIGLTVFLPASLTMGFFFGVASTCNWFFNSYDAAEQFAKNDFFPKLWNSFLELIGVKPLYFPGENPNRVSPWAMRARQLVRFTIFAGITYLGVYAVYAIGHMGTLGLFSYLMPGSITGADGVISIAKYGASWVQGLKWTVIIGGIVGGGFLCGVQVSRFSILATQLLSKAAEHYVNYGADIPNPIAKGIFLTVLSPFLLTYMGIQGLYAAGQAEKTYLSQAYNETTKYYQQATHLSQMLACAPLFFYHLIHNNMHALALINAASQGFLTVKPGEPVSQATEEFVGTLSSSIMCYGNKLSQENEIKEGRATNVQEVLEVDKLLFSEQAKFATGGAYRSLAASGLVADQEEELENKRVYVDDPTGEIRRRFQVV